jgi:hypothetical protein
MSWSTQAPEQLENQKQHARLIAARAALSHLERNHADGLISSRTHEILNKQFSSQVEVYDREVRETIKSSPEIEAEEIDRLYERI